jgi:hypothetical protein
MTSAGPLAGGADSVTPCSSLVQGLKARRACESSTDLAALKWPVRARIRLPKPFGIAHRARNHEGLGGRDGPSEGRLE